MANTIAERVRSIFSAKSTKPIHRVKLTRGIVIRLDDGPQSFEAGTVLEVSEEILEKLDRSDFEEIQDATRKRPAIQDPTPPRPQAAPLPPRWDELPQCFRTWHDASEQVRTARDHVEAMRRTIESELGFNFEFKDYRGPILFIRVQEADPRNINGGGAIDSGKGFVDTSDPQLRRLNALLYRRLREIVAEYERTVRQERPPLERARLECGLHRLDAEAAANALAGECRALGFALFSERIKPLGLAEVRARQLYTGSADFERFEVPDSNGGGQVFLGCEPGGEMLVGSDLPVHSEATYLLAAKDRMPQLETQVADGRKALSKAARAA